MALGPLIFFAVLALVYHPLMVSDDTDQATLDRQQKHKELLAQEMGRLQVEFDQKDWSWDSRQKKEDLVASDLPAEDGTWDGWPYVGLVILVIFGCCRHTMEKEPHYDSSTDSSSASATDEYDTDVEPEAYEPNHMTLEAFYDSHIELETSDLSSMCHFVESLVNDLLNEGQKALPYQNTLPLMENCIGVDSAFEGWHTQQLSTPFAVIVPLLPPKGHSFRIESSDFEGGPSKHGHILVEMECVCKRQRLLGDVVCFLHHPEQELSEDKQGAFLLHVLCTSSHLDAEKTVQWFQSMVGKAWDNLRHKYKLELTPQTSSTTCRLKLAFPSGRSILVDLILGVQQGYSLVFLVSHYGGSNDAKGTIWLKTFAVQELLFFKWVSQRVPERSCHLKCLQILIYFKESSASGKNPILTNYHYKTCLMHLLLHRPLSNWGPENFATRLQEILLYLHNALRKKYLEHFLIGNISLPIQIPMPQVLRSAEPLNLFEYLAADPKLHTVAVKESVEVVEQVRALCSHHEK